MANKNLKSIKFPGLTDTYVVPQVDTTLTQTGRPADAKATGDAISALGDSVDEEIDALKEDLSDYTGNQSYAYTKDKSVTKTSPTTQATETNWESVVVQCAAGDTFSVKGYGGNNTRLWMFADSNGTLLTSSDAGVHTEDYIFITAPANAAYLSCNSQYTSIKGALIKNVLLKDFVNSNINRIDENVFDIANGFSLPASAFEKGALSGGANGTYRSACRIRTIEKHTYPFDITVTIVASNTSVELDTYDAYGTYVTYHTYTGNGTTFTISKNTVFRLMIDGLSGLTEDTLSVADIYAKFTMSSISVDQNAKDIANLSKNIVPDYYFANDYIQNKSTKAQKQTGNGMISFGFITDAHTGNSACKSMCVAKYVDDNTSAIPFMIYGGDTPETNTGDETGFYAQAMKWQEMMSQFGKDRVYQCRGNHDYLTTATGVDPMTYGEIRSLVVGNLYENVVFADADLLSYYFDVDGTNTRIIVLDAYSISNDRDNAFTGYVGISDKTYQWFVDDALKVDNKNVIVVIHEPINISTSSSNLTFLRDILSAYVKHEQFSGSYGATTINVDFSTYTSNLVCVLSGHKHYDAIGCDNGFVTIITTCDGIYGTGRASGSITEGAFDIISIDYTNHIAYCTRIGAGNDRIIHLDIVTDISSALTSMISNATWSTSDSQIATVSNGQVTKVSSGNCYISATASETEEIWGVNL